MIDKNAAAVVACGCVALKETTCDGGKEMIGGNTVARSEVALFENHTKTIESTLDLGILRLTLGLRKCGPTAWSSGTRLGSEAGSTLEILERSLGRDKIVGAREKGSLMEGGFGVLCTKFDEPLARSHEEADPLERGVRKMMVPK